MNYLLLYLLALVSLEEFSMFSGTWVYDSGRQTSTEVWQIHEDRNLSGSSITLNNSSEDTLLTEKLAIIARNDEIVYIAHPSFAETPTEFKLTSFEDDIFIFENPEHDFPSIIKYHFTTDTTLTVSIGNKDKQTLMEFKKIEAK